MYFNFAKRLEYIHTQLITLQIQNKKIDASGKRCALTLIVHYLDLKNSVSLCLISQKNQPECIINFNFAKSLISFWQIQNKKFDVNVESFNRSAQNNWLKVPVLYAAAVLLLCPPNSKQAVAHIMFDVLSMMYIHIKTKNGPFYV